MLAHVHSQRALVLGLLALAALSAMLLTNDVSLFLMLPLALALCEQVALPRLRVVTLVALAVNAGSTLSPVGNPQNLLLWRHAGVGMRHFVLAMAPVVAIMAACLLGSPGGVLFRSRPCSDGVAPPRASLDGVGGMLLVLLTVAGVAAMRIQAVALGVVLAALLVVSVAACWPGSTGR